MGTLDNLRKEAKRWLKDIRDGLPSARARLTQAWPEAPAEPGLRDIQHALAREHGFESWTAFTAAAAAKPVAPVSPTIARLEALAHDLVLAYQTGDTAAMERLVAQFGGHATHEWVRAAVHEQLRVTPQSEMPEGTFALPHARLLIARYGGFQNWRELERTLDFRLKPEATSGVRSFRLQAEDPSLFEPGMIRPIEMKVGFRVRMRDGSHVTTSQVWDVLVASRNGDLPAVQRLVTQAPALVLCDYNYMPPLHLAVREGHFDTVVFLADRGAANPRHVTYPYRESLVTVARDRGFEDIARLLEERYAAEVQDRQEEEGGEIEYERDEDRVRFQKLVNTDAVPEVEAMLRARPELALDPFAFWSEGILSMPANRGDRRMLELLLRFGASVPQVTKWGAWYYFKRYDVAEFLMEHGMSPVHMNCHHTTLLHDMAYTGDVRKATLLLDRGAEIDAVDEEFRSTPLGLAARFGKRDMVELLLDRRADPNCAGAPWATPLEWARKKGHPDIERMLVNAGARVGRPQTPKSPPAPPPLRPAPDPVRVNPPRWLPVRPDLAKIEREVAAEGGDDATRLRIAREYGAETWKRLVLACQLVDALWRDDLKTVRAIITAHPQFLHEDALVRAGSNWGPPMTYAANIPRNRIIRALHDLGATDHDSALDRAVLQGELDTARLLLDLGAQPPSSPKAFEGPAETLNAQGMAFLIEAGVELTQETAPIAMVLETYSRNPLGKHQILELFVRHGIDLPDTPPMAVHRGRIDLLERHFRRDPQLLSRTFAHAEIFPPGLGCHTDETLALTGTPLGGAGLLAMCIEYDEMEMAAWMVEHGADVNLRARVDDEGFGGQTPLFHCVVALGGGRHRHDTFARLLLNAGADPAVRASLRKALRGADDESMHEYRNVTAVEWGEQFHDRSVVNELALRLVKGRLS